MIDLALPSDLQVTIFLIVISLIISFVIFLFSRNKLLAITIFSILSNANLFQAVLSRTRMFHQYNIEWLQCFTVFVWPIINLALIIILAVKYFKSKKA